jgi:signal transduction histidine kinase
LEADRGKVKQVLLNLLTNAIKYNREQGEIHITVIPPTNPKSGDIMACIQVQDTGRGISEENQQRMFEKFYRASDTSGYTQGTGLGLVIAKKIAEAHGGEMGFKSQLDVGTTFHFTIPISVPPENPPEATNPPDEPEVGDSQPAL